MPTQGFSTEHIDYIEKNFLDAFSGKIDSKSLQVTDIGQVKLLKVEALSNFWDSQGGRTRSLRLLTEDTLSGFCEAGIPLIAAIFGKPDGIEVGMGTFGDAKGLEERTETMRTAFRSAFPGIVLRDTPEDYLGTKLAGFNSCALLTGTPAEKDSEEKAGGEPLNRLIRGLYGRNWGFLVISTPVPNSDVNSLSRLVLNEMRLLANAEQSLGAASPIGKRYKDLLQVYLTKLQIAKAQGLWHSAIFMFSDKAAALTHVGAVAKSAFVGRKSLPDRIRTLRCETGAIRPGLILNKPPEPPGHFRYPYSLMTTLHSADLSVFVHLPSLEMPGFEIKPFARFKVAGSDGKRAELSIGQILDQGNTIGRSYNLSLEGLKKHGLVVGTTGSGKTNTVVTLLLEAWKAGIPFLVVEPVKSEYRNLLLNPDFAGALRVFTLGDNNISPFRINPFEIFPGVPVQYHIDLLKSVFQASFFMWGPLPHVLERCLHEIYLDRGWNTASGENLRGAHRDAHPRMSDFYRKVDEVVEGLGYGAETSAEVRSALKTRIDSLRVGGKGLMLDTRTSIPFDALLSKPTILELQALGDDEEKSFMMGLLLAMMYEHYISKGMPDTSGLRHLTVIEEAHRLLANVSAENPYVGNTKGNAVQTFTNILAEIRAYGEGFIIAEQIPSKLSVDVIKNTNLKVMHRVVAEDDRKVMGASMNLDERELKEVVAFRPGHAAVFSDGDQSAFHVEVPYRKIEGQNISGVNTGQVVRQAMRGFREEMKNFAPFDGCSSFCAAVCEYRDRGLAVSSRFKFASQIPLLMLSLLDESSPPDSVLLQMNEAVAEEGNQAKNQQGVGRCAAIHALETYVAGLGDRYFWDYEQVEKLKQVLLPDFIEWLEGRSGSDGDDFRRLYRELCTGKQPSSLCRGICPERVCAYRFHLAQALGDNYYHQRFVETIDQGGEDMWESLLQLCREAVTETVLPEGRPETTGRVALCFAFQKCSSMNSFTLSHVRKLLDGLMAVVPAGPVRNEEGGEHGRPGKRSQSEGFKES